MNNVFLATQSGKLIQAQLNDEDLEELIVYMEAGDPITGIQTSLEGLDGPNS